MGSVLKLEPVLPSCGEILPATASRMETQPITQHLTVSSTPFGAMESAACNNICSSQPGYMMARLETVTSSDCDIDIEKMQMPQHSGTYVMHFIVILPR